MLNEFKQIHLEFKKTATQILTKLLFHIVYRTISLKNINFNKVLKGALILNFL
jgi:hypothetical protein